MIHVVGTDDNPMTSCPCHEEACTNIAIHHGYYLSLCAEFSIKDSSLCCNNCAIKRLQFFGIAIVLVFCAWFAQCYHVVSNAFIDPMSRCGIRMLTDLGDAESPGRVTTDDCLCLSIHLVADGDGFSGVLWFSSHHPHCIRLGFISDVYLSKHR